MRAALKKLWREKLFRGQRGLCAYCGEAMADTKRCKDPQQATFDHIRPVRDGGKWTWKNLVLAHRKCNGERGHAPCPPFVIDLSGIGGRTGWRVGWDDPA